ncbi:Apyrase [Pseudolycoriella hygida]|uniref:Apyrase n=1 Tax=Pseudolycoriella hygida TaxID=35572 RepID=A0A9Q0MPL2_9DIPT|nr:Apyrase [Pseudolycoriella hygida]
METIGNHEFDHGVEGLVPFLEDIKSEVVVANIDDSDEPTMQGKYKKSVIIDKYERKIGVIGVILSTTDKLARTGKIRFKDEIETVRNEATILKNQGVDIIIVLSHCGLDVDYAIARGAGSDIDIIVGGHSHTFMFTGDNPPGPDRPLDEYPAIVRQENGHKVLIVQASAYTKYIGDLTVYFDADGEVNSWEGYPIFLDSNIKQDEDILKEIQPWKELVDIEGIRVLGTSKVYLSRDECSSGECNIGNFITDASVHYYIDQAQKGEWTRAAIALTNFGGIRTSLNAGVLTYADVATTIPFENTLDLIELRGDHLLATLERNILPASGIRIVYNITKPIGERVVSVDLLCNECTVPRYYPLDLMKMYRIVVNSYMAGGGDGLSVLNEQKRNHVVGPIDMDVLINYIDRQSPIMIGIEGRTTILQ